jgi:ribosomal protein L21E
MEDIPQPASDSYSVGDQVQIYISSDDPDSRYHGIICEVTGVLSDDLDTETGRTTDAYSYTVQDVESGEELPVLFRHQDLVPVEDNQ